MGPNCCSHLVWIRFTATCSSSSACAVVTSSAVPVCAAQCLCSYHCASSEERLEQTRQLFSSGFTGIDCEDVKDRPKSKAVQARLSHSNLDKIEQMERRWHCLPRAEARAKRLDTRGVSMGLCNWKLFKLWAKCDKSTIVCAYLFSYTEV